MERSFSAIYSFESSEEKEPGEKSEGIEIPDTTEGSDAAEGSVSLSVEPPITPLLFSEELPFEPSGPWFAVLAQPKSKIPHSVHRPIV